MSLFGPQVTLVAEIHARECGTILFLKGVEHAIAYCHKVNVIPPVCLLEFPPLNEADVMNATQQLRDINWWIDVNTLNRMD
ncbi:hypothetical protein [Shewanella surugensis]|uniref:Uncharacterized protein n=1 Tax=Shewanella surugensis TaxID=212020 RepID=A0ABT0LIY8_9GAMM|nr:hypothetical protein [Shewanella surugensis]MCL1127664.1 hypothetical protein [Shewanella surugensis]